MRARLVAIALTVSVVVLSALAGIGEDDLGLSGPGESLRLALIRSPEVQKELEVTDEQRARIGKIADASKEARKKVESVYKGQPKAKATDPAAKQAEELRRDEMEREFEVLSRQSDEDLNRVLTPKQKARLTQLVIRAEGPAAFVKPELIDALNLGPDQVEAIREILDGRRAAQEQYKEQLKQASELAKSSGLFELEKIRKDQSKGQMRSFSYKLHKQVMAQIARVLTRRQRDRYDAMLGPPFDLLKLTDREGRSLLGNSGDLGVSLLRSPSVQEELKLTEAQKGRLASGDAASKVLDAAQKTRLRQIVLQGEGASAVLQPDVVRALRLSERQLEQIRAALDGLGEAGHQLRESQKEAADRLREALGGTVDPIQEKTRKEQEKEQIRTASAGLRGQATHQIHATLTRKQKETFDRLLGEPFDFSKLRTPPGAGKAEVAKAPRPDSP